MRIRDALVVFSSLKGRTGGKLVFLDELNVQRLAGFFEQFVETVANTACDGEFVYIEPEADVVIVMPPNLISRYEQLEPGKHKINIIGVCECQGDEIFIKKGIEFPEFLCAVKRIEGTQVINPQGTAAKLIAGPATVIQLKNINLKGCTL